MATKDDADVILCLETAIRLAGSLRKWAKAHDFSPAFVSDVLTGRRSITERLAGALGFERPGGWKKVK